MLGEFCTGRGAGGVLLGEFCTGWSWEYGCAASSGVRCERKFALLGGVSAGARESSPCMSKMAKYCRLCVCGASFVPVGVLVGCCWASFVPVGARKGPCWAMLAAIPRPTLRCTCPLQRHGATTATTPCHAASRRNRVTAPPGRSIAPLPDPATATPPKARQARHNKACNRDAAESPAGVPQQSPQPRRVSR